MQCPNCGREAININGREICLDCGIEIAQSAAMPEPAEEAMESSQINTAADISDNVFTDTSAFKSENLEKEENISSGLNVPDQSSTEQPVAGESSLTEIISPERTEVETESQIEVNPKEKIGEVTTQQESTIESPVEQRQEEAEEKSREIPVTVATEKEELPKVNLGSPQSKNFESVESKPMEEIVPKEPVVPQAEIPSQIQPADTDFSSEELRPEMLKNESKETASQIEVSSNIPENAGTEVQSVPRQEIPQQAPLFKPVDTISYGNVNLPDQAPGPSFSGSSFPGQSGGNMEVLRAHGISGGRIFKKIFITTLTILILIAIFGIAYIYKNKFQNLINTATQEESAEVIE